MSQGLRMTAVVLGVCAALLLGVAGAQAPGITAKPLQRTPLAGDERRDVLLVDVRFAPGATTGRHTHAGEEYAVVLEGELELHVDGEAVRTAKAGDSYRNSRGVVHETRNAGAVPAHVVSTFIVDRDQPLIQKVP